MVFGFVTGHMAQYRHSRRPSMLSQRAVLQFKVQPFEVSPFLRTYLVGIDESPRVLRRLFSLRGLSHEEVEQVFT
jgi:hypothetical protein